MIESDLGDTFVWFNEMQPLVFRKNGEIEHTFNHRDKFGNRIEGDKLINSFGKEMTLPFQTTLLNDGRAITMGNLTALELVPRHQTGQLFIGGKQIKTGIIPYEKINDNIQVEIDVPYYTDLTCDLYNPVNGGGCVEIYIISGDTRFDISENFKFTKFMGKQSPSIPSFSVSTNPQIYMYNEYLITQNKIKFIDSDFQPHVTTDQCTIWKIREI